jgi:hypothetical protein
MTYYDSKIPIAVNDRATYANMEGTIVYIIDDRSYSADFPESEWSYLSKGLGFLPDNGILIHLDEPDEDLYFLQKAK